MLSVTSKSYYFPQNSDLISDDSVGLAYFNEIKDFFVQTLGFFVYGEMKTYTDAYCYFFSDTQNGHPIFCIHTPNQSNISYKFSRFILEPCSFNEIEYFPLNPEIDNNATLSNTGPDTLQQGIVFSTYKQPYSIVFYRRASVSNNPADKDMRNNKIIVQDVKFLDGRRIIFFKTQAKLNNSWVGCHNWGALFFTDIVFKNNIIRDWIFFGVALGSSFNPLFNQHIVNKNISSNGTNFINLQRILAFYPDSADSVCPYSTSSVVSGLLPSIYGGKDYLIMQNFYIGDEAYIPNIYRYSNISRMKISDDGYNFIVTNKGNMGDYITIKNNNYLVLCNRFLYGSADYYGYDISKIGEGCHGDKHIGDRTGRLKTVNTESLMISI